MSLEHLKKSVAENAGGGGGDFLKLEDGESAVLVVRGNFAERKRHWIGGQSEECPPLNCPHCGSGDRPKVSWVVNAYNLGAKKMQIWELTYYTMDEYIDEADGADPWATFTVRRRGTGTSTRYEIRRGPPVSEEKRREIDEIELADVSSFGKLLAPQDDDIPF